MMRIFRMYSLNNFSYYHTAVLAVVIMLYVIFLVLNCFSTAGGLCLFTPYSCSSFPNPPPIYVCMYDVCNHIHAYTDIHAHSITSLSIYCSIDTEVFFMSGYYK